MQIRLTPTFKRWRYLSFFLLGLLSTGLFSQSADSLKEADKIRNESEADTLMEALRIQQEQAEQLRIQSMMAQRELAYAQSQRFAAFMRISLIVLIIALIVFIVIRIRQRRRNKQQMLKLKEEREKKEQLAKLNAFKSRFFTNISHEFRTPLTLILGQNQQLQAELNDPSLAPKFDRIDRNARRLLELVNQVLKLSKLESGSIELEPRTIDLIPFLKNILFSFESMAQERLQKLIFQQEVNSLPIVVDPEKLEQVFCNLLINALKFTPEKGSILLKTELLGARVHIGVIDTGIGIPEDQLPYVFDRFYQAEGGDTHASPGTGIGLALAKELVELHAGTIRVKSELGKGSEFWVDLPGRMGDVSAIPESYESQVSMGEPLQIAADIPSPVPNGNNKSHILIVEDHPDVRDYLNSELQLMGYRVSQAINGRDGLSKAGQDQPDLIISDVMMPEMDGYAFVQGIRSELITCHIPIILLTAKASDESKLNGLQVGADAYLTKPFNRSELQIRVGKLIEQREQLRQRFSQAVHIRPEEVSAIPMDQAFVKQVTDIIEQHLSHEQFGVEALSKEVAMSVTHLNRKLKAIIGQSAGKLIRSMRLQRAADLISQQAGTISDIAYELGFSSPNNFSTAFKKQFGTSPSEYAKG
ncbi:MAG: response regulator [Bacteroidota bacterium]